MAWAVKLDPAGVATGRFELDLNTGPIRVEQVGINWGDAAIQAYMADQQKWGSVPVSFRVPNRTVTIPLGIGMDESGSFEAAKLQLQQKVARLHEEGGWLLRQRAGGAPMYADIVSATCNIPDQWGETGEVEPNVPLTLECLPDFYGDLITLDTIVASGETQAVLQSGGQQALIQGDWHGRAQINVLDQSGSNQYGLLWGFRARNYSSTASSGLVWPSSTLTRGTGATLSALSGARGGQAVSQNLTGAAWNTVVSGTGSHVGSYQIKARVYSSSAGVQYRLQWSVGDQVGGLYLNDQVALPGAGNFYLLDLGQVRLDPAPVGNQSWTWSIQAQQPSGASVSANVDMVYLQPLDEPSGQLEGVVADLNPVILANNRTQLRYDGAMRAVAGGLVYKPLGGEFGERARIPTSGLENRPVQLFLKPSRGDLVSSADSASQDAFAATVSYRPSYLYRP